MAQETVKVYDVIIIGGGPAGLTAGLYTSRARLSTLLIESGVFGGQMAMTDLVENYPGFPNGVSGSELGQLMEEQARRFGLKTIQDEVLEVGLDGELKKVMTHEGPYLTRALIICTGTEYRKLGVPGEEEYRGRGVSYCATCDGAFFKDSKVIVVGGGDSALTEALFLTRFVKELYIVHRRDSLRATKIYQERAETNPKIKFIWNSVVQAIKGDSMVRSVTIKNVKTGETKEIDTDGVFLFIGLVPRTQFLKGIVSLDENGYILTNEHCETSVRGIFAAGDCRKKLLRQISTSVGDGATAAFAAEKYLEEGK